MKKIQLISLLFISYASYAQTEDPYLWLEEVDGAKAMEWVTTQNKKTVDKLSADPNYQVVYDKCMKIYNSTDRIAYPTIYGNYVYNFWQDKEHVRGIWRRCSIENYIDGKADWTTLIDVDQLAEQDNIKWVFKGAEGLYPNYNRFLISLSKGGGDAVVVKEFDPEKKSFLTDGFLLPEAKGGASYLDENTLIVSTDFGDGTLTTSGYPRQVKLWTRGSELKDAKLIFEGTVDDVSSSGYKLRDGAENYLLLHQGTTFYTNKTFVWKNNKAVQLNLPEDSQISGILNNQLLLNLKSDWKVKKKTYKQGSLVSVNFTELIAGKLEVLLVYEADEFSSIGEVSVTKNKLLLNIMRNVQNELYAYTYRENAWIKKKVETFKPEDISFGTISLISTDENSDHFFFTFQNFLTPSSLYIANAETFKMEVIKALPSFFESSPYEVKQYMARSIDGTMIPYFLVAKKDLVLNGENPTLLYAYGGFEASSLPYYSGTIGDVWLENGGVYVLANIRGGGEFGPKWHQAGLKEKRQNVYNDFHRVAEDLITRNITSPKHLGIMGGSNGGLLMGVAFTQRPDLYNAVVCQVPLLDMKRFNKLLAGASWMGEYGNPDIAEEWAYIQKYSPYQNLKIDAAYPEVFFTTSTRDDRVHPGHARKMAAKMIDMGYPIYYFENTEGGHAGSSTNEQRAHGTAMQYAYLLMKLKR